MMASDRPVYLRPNIQVEPLVDSWYAWSHLIPPQTAARNITERHMKIMDSYINAPVVHAKAVENPKLAGGPFMDYGGKRVSEVKALRDATKQKRQRLFELSGAIAATEDLLRSQARGFSLQPLYSQIPESLRGYVELIYDINNNPSLRFIEPLLYRSHFYDPSAQALAFSIIAGDDRPFVLSTPRLPADNVVCVNIPFHDEAIDDIFRMKKQPQLWSKIRERLQLDDDQAKVFEQFVGEEPAPPYEPYTGKGVRWRYFGHACILVENKNASFLFDPVLSYTYEAGISRFTYGDLPDHIDYVVITHNHQDHVLFETLLQIRHKVGSIIVPRGSGSIQDPSVKLLLEAVGFRNVIEMSELESIPTQNGSITGIPFLGEHSDLDVRSKLAYLIRMGKHALLFAADSCNIEPKLYERLHDVIGDVDVLFLGMECDGAPLTWLYGPLLTKPLDRKMDESRRLAGSNHEQASDIVDRLNCKEVYVYAMGQEPWLNHVMSLKYTAESRPIVESNKLIEYCRQKDKYAERLFGEKEILMES
jgi:L-ascorbate metabolism protein UlaG (beta-lactamase superfamily)